MQLYNPLHFKEESDTLLRKLVGEYPFATLITPEAGDVVISHLPLLLEERDGAWFFLGHMAKSNPHWKILEGKECLAMFRGPDAYVSPLWYSDGDVPTWNYVAGHFSGRAKLVKDAEGMESSLRKLAQRFEGRQGWKFALPSGLTSPEALQRAIVAFEFAVERREGKFKLSQNRTSADVAGVVRGLEARGTTADLAVSEWMQLVHNALP